MGTMKRYRLIGYLVLAMAVVLAIVMLPRRSPVPGSADPVTKAVTVGQVESTEERRLIQSYAVASNSQDKLRLLKALGQKGGDDAVAFFTNMLLQGYSDKSITGDEEVSLVRCIKALGLLSSRSDAAYEFVNAGTDPGFWQRQRLWHPPLGAKARDFLLVGDSILALGLTGRPDALHRIEKLAQTSPPEYHRQWSGSIVTAVYYDAMIKKMGTERFLSEVFMSGNSLAAYVAWTKTEEGRRWEEWVESTLQ